MSAPASGAGARFFFYGTLLDADVRTAVAGRAVAAAPATLAGWRVVPVEHGRYPMVTADPARSATGLVTEPLDLAAAARLSFFEEDGYQYTCRLADVSAADVATDAAVLSAWVYVPLGGMKRGAGVWDIAAWAPRFKRDFLIATRRAMARYGAAEAARFEALWRRRLAEGR